MTSQSLPIDNGYLSMAKRRPVMIQVREVPAISPGWEELNNGVLNAVQMLGASPKVPMIYPQPLLDGLQLKRPTSGDGWRATNPVQQRLRRRSSLGAMEHRPVAGGQSKEGGTRRRPDMRIPLGKTTDPTLNSSNGAERSNNQTMGSTTLPKSRHQHLIPGVCAAAPIGLGPRHQTQPSASTPGLIDHSCNGTCGIVLPLTPPDDIDAFEWDARNKTHASQSMQTTSTVEQGQPSLGQLSVPHSTLSASRPSGIPIPEREAMSSDPAHGPSWLENACESLVSALGDSSNIAHIHMIAQGLPSQSKMTDAKPVFEKVVEAAQRRYVDTVPYVTITHAVSQVMSMDEVPASPPATPNTSHSSGDYFQDQTIFTHAAVVPAYHARSQPSSSIQPRPISIIAAPMSIQISTLERYIPPSSAQEYMDFFAMSRRSYLVDRLLELSAANGALLFVYPTKTGATTFAQHYLAPIIEPFLRQFVLLNNLYTDVADTLGRMDAIEHMKEFPELRAALQRVCQDLGSLATPRGLRTQYQVVHAETATVTLERDLWVHWFLEQEQPRIRHNLVNYHKSGGRMPARTEHIDTTPGMLAREVAEGIRQSRQPAGQVGIEVGVFVVRRTCL